MSVEWIPEGPIISGNMVKISSTELHALLTRYFEWFPQFQSQESEKLKQQTSAGPSDVMERAHFLATIRSCVDTYGRVPDEAEMEAASSELSRKMDLFYKFMLMQHFEAQLR